MPQEKMPEKKTWKIVAIVFIVLSVLFFIFWIATANNLTTERDYYRESTINLCDYSNELIGDLNTAYSNNVYWDKLASLQCSDYLI